MRHLLLILLAAGLPAPQQEPTPPGILSNRWHPLHYPRVQPALAFPIATRVQVRGADCALFPAGAVSYYNVQATFMPTQAQAAEAEKALATSRLATADPHAKNWYKKQPDPAYTAISTHLPLYRQQFYGFLNAKRQPCLFINAFPLERNFTIGQRWLCETVWVFDGGASFWQAKYNLLTHRCEYFSYNRMG